MFAKNSKNKKGNKIKNKRRVVLLKYKDRTERLILTTTVKRRKDPVKILQCNTEILREVKKTMYQNEEYPIFQAQLKKKIVPTCLRDNCNQEIERKDQQCRRYRRIKSRYEPKVQSKIRSESPIIISSDTDSDEFMYDNISSGSLSSYSTDDELEALIKSTRKRMKETDKEWKFIPRPVISTNNFENNLILSKCPSLNSLDTLVLEAEDSIFMRTTSSSSISNLPLNQEKITKLEPQETKNKEIKATYESVGKDYNESSNRTQHQDLDKYLSTYIPTIKPENMVKSEHKESYNELRSTCKTTKHVPSGYLSKIKAEPTNHVINDFSIKVSETVVKNKLKESNTFVTQERIYESQEQIYEKISAVVAKLEKDEFDSFVLELNNIDMKQELYSDIK